MFEPCGIRFYDKNYGEMILIAEGEYTGWLCYRLPYGDRHFVLLRKATDEEKKALDIPPETA